MISIFTDLTERSPTFGLDPVDTIALVQAKRRRSWISMHTDVEDGRLAWIRFLGKQFKGLDPNIYEKHFENVQDPHLRERALNSLKRAG